MDVISVVIPLHEATGLHLETNEDGVEILSDVESSEFHMVLSWDSVAILRDVLGQLMEICGVEVS